MYIWNLAILKLANLPNDLTANSTFFLEKPISMSCAMMGTGGGGDGFNFFVFCILATIGCCGVGGGR